MATIKIVIKNDSHAFTYETSPKESIAGVKAAYQESGKCSMGHPNYIMLLHKGKELQDDKSLAELGITDGDVLVHIEAPHEPFRPVNYKVLAQSIKNRRRHEDANMKMMQEDNIWAAGQDGTVHRLGLEKSLVSCSTNGGNQSHHFAPKKASTFFRGTARYQLYHFENDSLLTLHLDSMEGRWNGELATLPPQEEGSEVCANDLIFRDDEGVWSQRQTRTTISGLTTTYHSWLKPVSDGILKIETDDSTLRGCDITMQEIGTNILIITATSKRTGRPLLVETITAMDSSRRLRTVQRFDESGAFRTVYIMNEKRVVDAVSGALEKYENVF
ncbi:TPA: hypothetical protein N0F65_004166 [Lagenidium giganteum]|uniref:Ubiquitin-like domain-containing protein n=1 Tax=Lagenidium giganteum TaxID=4803 RepID=A0AAV2ZEW5_9STRA|nr:TPA: hypothetical protein N0F65_004166 [Lagenidium giganteum]